MLDGVGQTEGWRGRLPRGGGGVAPKGSGQACACTGTWKHGAGGHKPRTASRPDKDREAEKRQHARASGTEWELMADRHGGEDKERGTHRSRSRRGFPSERRSSAAERMKKTHRCWQKESGGHVDACGRGPPGQGREPGIASALLKCECQRVRAQAIQSVSRCRLDFLAIFGISLRILLDIAMTP